MSITKATDLWSYWIICWKTIVNHHDFYSSNLSNILLGGLGWKSPTLTVGMNSRFYSETAASVLQSSVPLEITLIDLFEPANRFKNAIMN